MDDDMDIDYPELQMALALSMLEHHQDAAPQQQAAQQVAQPPAPPAAPPTAAPPPAAGSAPDMAALLAAALAQFAGTAQVAGAPAAQQQPAAQAQQQQTQQQQQAQQQQAQAQQHPLAWASRAAAAAQPAAAAPVQVPPWAHELQLWPRSGWMRQLQQQQQQRSAQVQLPAAALAAAAEALRKALGAPVVMAGAAPAAAAPAGALHLGVAVSAETATLSPAAADALVGAYMARPAVASSGASPLQSLFRAYSAATAASTTPAVAAAAPLLQLVAARLAWKAAQLLENDEDDLYFEQGRHHTELLAALAGAPATMSPQFLDALLGATPTELADRSWGRVVTDGLAAFRMLKFEGGQAELGPMLVRLDLLTRPAPLVQFLARRLTDEAQSAQQPQPGPARLTSQAVLGPLLGVSTMVDAASALSSGRVVSPVAAVFTSLRGYPNNAGDITMTKQLLTSMLGQLHDAGHQVLVRIVKLKEAASCPAGAGKEAVMAWVAAIAAANEVRLSGGERNALRSLHISSSDAFCLNLAAVLLRMCMPFVEGFFKGSPKMADLFEKHLLPSYYTQHTQRLGGSATEATLAGERGVAAAGSAGGTAGGGSSASARSVWVADCTPAARPSFIADCFFLTQRLVRVGVVPAVNRYPKVLEALKKGAAGDDGDDGGGGSGEVALAMDCCSCQLMHPDMAVHLVQFVALEARWLAWLLADKSRHAAFSAIPESVVADMAAWLKFVIYQGEAEMLAAVNIGDLMDCIVMMLEHPQQVRSLLVVSKLVELLLAMLSPQLQAARRTVGGALGRTIMRPGEAALVASVLSSRAAHTTLVPALMDAYGRADFVVGLDVDRDDFDKFHMRHCIDLILLELWKDNACREGIRRQAASDPGGAFSSFLSAVINDVMYTFKDSLERLTDIHQIERSMADEKVWKAMAASERQDKEAFYAGQQGAARGFMSYAIGTLRLLNVLSGDDVVVRTFLRQPLLGRAAYGCLHFTEILVGPRCQQLAVKRPQQYHFDRAQLLTSVSTLMAQLSRGGSRTEFARALAEEPDYEAATLQAAGTLLASAHAYEVQDALAALELAAATAMPERAVKKRRSSDVAAAAAAAGADAGDGSDGSDEAGGSEARSDATASGGGGTGGDVEADVRQLALPGPSSYEDADAAYIAALQPLAMGVFDAEAPCAYNSQFAALAAQPQGDTAQKMKRLGRELRDLRGKTALPISASAAIFVRQDGERPDKVRCLMTGPADTPYEAGCFVFDVYFPAGYPNVPPLMVLDTTGGGRARFNPNLYADGKVCLSLLGTWHGGSEAEKWRPDSSSLYQILLSIQGMILVDDPYFNEPNVDLMRGKAEGVATSSRYNCEVRLATMRWAMLAQLRKPPPGFEDVVTQHFRGLRGVIMASCGRWLREAARVDEASYRRLLAAAQELRDALAAL